MAACVCLQNKLVLWMASGNIFRKCQQRHKKQLLLLLLCIYTQRNISIYHRTQNAI